MHQLSNERRGGAILHPHSAVGAWLCVATVEHQHLVLAVPSEELLLRAVALAFHQNLILVSQLLAIVLQGYFALQGDNLVQPASLLLLGNVVGQMLPSIGTLTKRVFEHVGVVIAHLTE